MHPIARRAVVLPALFTRIALIAGAAATAVASAPAHATVPPPPPPEKDPPVVPVDPLANVGPNALERESPRDWTFRYDIVFGGDPGIREIDPRRPCDPNLRARHSADGLGVTDGDLVLALVLEGAWTTLRRNSLAPTQLVLGQTAVRTPSAYSTFEDGGALDTTLAVTKVTDIANSVHSGQWRIEGEARSWASRIDESAAFRATWPAAWPGDLARWLAPQPGVESDDPIFTDTVARLLPADRSRLGPYKTAKRIVAWCLAEVRTTGRGDTQRGLDVIGAKAAAENGRGSEADLALVTTAMLRAANVPARIVVGIERGDGNDDDRLVAWGEFFLPGSGWVPYDPGRMRSFAVQNRRLDQPWPWFGTIPQLSDRIGLAHVLQPIGTVADEFPGLWGLRIRQGRSEKIHSRVGVSMSSNARGDRPD